jgi:hypothetical protein
MNFMQIISRVRIRVEVLAFLILFFILLSHAVCSSVSAATYYVSTTTGSNTNPGTEAQPWQTIKKAADTLVAGDTVYIKAGTYQERVAPKNSGTSGNYITYAAYTGDTVTIDGSSISLSLEDQDGLFVVENKSYIIISGLNIKNARPNDNNNGIYVDSSSYITIEKNYTYNTVSSGIGVWDSDHITIDGNEVELACNDGEQECITVSTTDTFEIKNNHVHDSGPGTMGGEGIDAKDGSTNGKIYKNHVHHIKRLGIYVDSWDKLTSQIEVYQNVVHDCADDAFTLAAESGGLLENIKIYNNIAYNNLYNGISISANGEAIYSHPMKNIYVVNNTFYNNGDSTWGGGVLIENPEADDVVIRNNICSQNGFSQIQVEASGKNLTIDHNLIDGYRGYATETYGTDYVTGDPLFVSPSGAVPDFQLQQNSPAIDKGSSSDAPADDYEGNVRPYGSGYDIGAYEYGSATTATTTTGPVTTTTIDSTTTTTTAGACPAEEIYGEDSEETELLRYFRDSILKQIPEGQELIRIYYLWSPTIVRTMEEDEAFKEDVQEMIDGVMHLLRGVE